ncbi:MAG: O-antigen ligase family protein [Pyrinomonadaceae bacterium]
MPPRRSNRSSDLLPGETTVYEKGAVVLIAAIPMLAMAGYGSVDIWALIPLSILTIALLLLWAIDGLRAGEIRFNTSLMQVALIGLVVIGCIQLLPLGGGPSGGSWSSLSMDAFATRGFTVRLLLLLIYFAAALTYLNGKRRVQHIVTAVIIFGSAMAFAGILQKLTSPGAIYGLRPTPQAIPFGPFVNQHHFTAFMEMTVGLTLAMMLGSAVGRDRKALYLIALALMLIAASMTGSRGGMIGLIATAGFVLVAVYASERSSAERTRSGLKIALGAVAVLVITAFGVVYLSGADPLVRGIGLQSGQADVTSGRLHFWSVGLKIFLENPVIGAGFDAFGVAFTRFDTWNGYYRVEQAHNDYLQVLADGGILAFACVAAFLFLLGRRGIQVIRTSTSPARRSVAIGALAGCFGIAVHSIFDFPLRTPSNSYFFLLLAAFATVSLGDERERR